MDITNKFKLSRTEYIEGFRYLLVHGHKHSVKRSYDRLIKEARAEDVNVVFYGHTHIPKVEIEEGVVFINPGSIAQPRNRAQGTYLVMKLDDDLTSAELTFYDQDHNIQHDLTTRVSLAG